MSKFLTIAVGSVTRMITAENVITVDHPTNTTTTITYNHAQSTADVLTITHTSQTSRDVAEAIDAALLLVHSGARRPEVFAPVNLPSGITVSAIALG